MGTFQSMPFLDRLAQRAERASRRIGDAASWLLLAVAGAGMAVLLLRHVLGAGSIGLPPAYVWCTALVVMSGGGMAFKRMSAEVAFLSRLGDKNQGRLMAAGAVAVLLPWAFLLDLFAGSLSQLAPGLVGEVGGTLEDLWWRLAVDAGALTLLLEGLSLLFQGLALMAAPRKGAGV